MCLYILDTAIQGLHPKPLNPQTTTQNIAGIAEISQIEVVSGEWKQTGGGDRAIDVRDPPVRSTRGSSLVSVTDCYWPPDGRDTRAERGREEGALVF